LAQFNADISLSVAVDKALAGVAKVERAISRITETRVNIQVEGERRVAAVTASVNRLGRSLRLIRDVGAAGSITTFVAAVSKIPGIDFGVLEKAVQTIGGLNQSLLEAAGSAPLLAASLTAATAAAVAFAPQILGITKNLLNLAKRAAELGAPLNTLFSESVLNINNFTAELGDATKAVELYRARIFELNETVSNLGRRQRSLQSALDKTNSGSETAAKIASKLVNVTQRLNAEQDAQNDLLREAAGLRSRAVENRATNTFRTTQRRQDFQSQQQTDRQAVQNALQELAVRDAIEANEQLNIKAKQEQDRLDKQALAASTEKVSALRNQVELEERISSIRSRRLAREASARQQRLIGNPNQFPGGVPVPGGERTARLAVERDYLRLALAQNTAVKQRAMLEGLVTKALNSQRAVRENNLKQQQRELELAKRAVKLADLRNRQERGRELGQRAESIALGVGFPLLFGGGAGSVLGSLAGSFAGRGFGGQILGGAIGQAIDEFAQKTAEIGVALNPLTADIDRLIQATGLVGTETGAYIKSLEDAADAGAALEAAARELARVIGQEGVAALDRYGEQTQAFSNQWQIAMTQMGAALAGFLQGPLSAVLNSLQQANALRAARASGDPQLQGLATQFDRAGRSQLFGGTGGGFAEQERILTQIIARQQEIASLEREREQITKVASETQAQDKRLLEAQIELAKTDGDLTNDKVYKIREIIIQKEFERDLQKDINEGVSSELTQLTRKLKLTQLATDRQEALAKATENSAKAGRSALDVQRAVLSLQGELIKLALQTADLDVERTAAVQGQSAAIREQLTQAQARLELEGRALDLEYQRKLLTDELSAAEQRLLTSIYTQQKANLEAQAQTKFRILQLSLAELEVEKQIAALNRERAVEDINTGRGNELGRLQAQLANPFGGEELERINQEFDQLERRASTLTPLVRELQDLQTRRAEIGASASAEELASLDANIKLTEQKINLEGQWLSQIDQTEQALLRQQQLFERYGFIADEISSAMSAAITNVITGTGTVEEAFSQMFANIGKAFVDMATQMLAQRLFLTVLQALTGGNGGFGGFSGTGPFQFPGGNGFAEGFTGANFFADGGIVTRPTYFKYANGGEMQNGLMGEAGPEAIMPLKRGADGRLGVSALDLPFQKQGSEMSPEASAAFSELQSASIPFTKTTERLMTERSERETIAAINNPEPLDVRFESQVINGVEYVTAEQHQRGMVQAAERGRALTLSTLQNSVKTRKKVGMA
jgi:hypothetical protein